MSGDGIYSRYLGHLSQPGRYRFNILVDDNDNNAFYVLMEDDKKVTSAVEAKLNNKPLSEKVNYGDLYFTITSKRTCCGSSTLPSLKLEQNPSKMERTGIFRRQILGPVVHLDKSSDKLSAGDQVPPSRIGDLKIRPLPGKISL